MRHILVFICCIVLTCKSSGFSGLESNTDSLKALLEDATGETRLKILNELAYKLRDVSAAESKKYSQLALNASYKLNSRYWLAVSYNNLGFADYNSGDFLSASAAYDSSCKYFELINDIHEFIATSLNHARVYATLNQFYKSLELQYEAMELSINSGDTNGMIKSYFKIATTYIRIKDLDNAIHYIDKAVELSEELNLVQELAEILTTKGIILLRSNHLIEALHFMNRSLYLQSFIENKKGMVTAYRAIGDYYIKIKEYNKSLSNYKKALQLSIQIDFKRYIGTLFTNISHTYELMGKITMSLEYNKKALNARIKYGDHAAIGSSYLNIGNSYLILNQLDSAEYYLKKGLEISLESKHLLFIENSYYSLYELALVNGDYNNALGYYGKYEMISDSITIQIQKRELSELDTKYTLDKKEIELEIQNLKLKRKQDQLIIIGAALMLGIVILIFIYYRYRINKKISTRYQRLNVDLKDKFVRSAHELRDKESQFKNLVEQIPMGVYRSTPDGLILFVNNELVKIMGYESMEELKMLNLEKEKAHHRMTRDNFKNEIRKSGEIKGMESIWTKKDGSKIIVSEYARLVKDKDGNELYFEGVVEDATARKLTERKLKNALEKSEESDKLKSSFLATIQHELRTPLNSIMGFSEIMSDDPELSQVNRDYINLIFESGNSLLKVINDILDISLITSGKFNLNPQTFQLLPLLESIISSQRKTLKNNPEKENIELKFVENFDPSLDRIYTDQYRLAQVISNLLDNAIKFTYEGLIEFGYEKSDKNYLQFYVKDSGIGIPEDKQEYIFEQFRQGEETDTRQFGGSGLGLSICKNLVDKLGGDIRVESEPEKGSVFYFTIRYRKIDIIEDYPIIRAKEIFVEPAKSDFNWQEFKILIAEDNYSNFLLIKTFLRKTGVTLYHAQNGEEAIEMSERLRDIDLIIMDIQLPGISGYQAAQKIKAFNPTLPIIAVTAYSSSGDKEQALSSGCDDHVGKPVKQKELLRVLDKHLRSNINKNIS